MTENGKIYFVKNTILNFLAEQQLSIGLCLYIIKDLQQNLQKTYNNIVKNEIQQFEKENHQLKEKENNQQNEKEEEENILDLKDTGLTITSFS